MIATGSPGLSPTTGRQQAPRASSPCHQRSLPARFRSLDAVQKHPAEGLRPSPGNKVIDPRIAQPMTVIRCLARDFRRLHTISTCDCRGGAWRRSAPANHKSHSPSSKASNRELRHNHTPAPGALGCAHARSGTASGGQAAQPSAAYLTCATLWSLLPMAAVIIPRRSPPSPL
jgi:hypothetical protein